MNVIRIPTKFAKSIKRLSDKDRLSVFDSLLKIGEDEVIKLTDSVAGDLVELIYGEWMNMESRNGTKPSINHISGGPGTNSPSDPEHRVEYSRVEENRIEENKVESEKVNNPLRKFNEEAVAVAIENRNVTQHLSICFFDLGYIPAKDETEESLREWISNIAKIKSKSGDEMIDIIHKWHAYWKGNKKQVKNHKASLLNQHSLKGN